MTGGRLLAVPDKFRGTATGAEVAGAVGRAARAAGWTADEQPLSDGGEGLLEAVGGEERRTTVSGPLGAPVEAGWRWLAEGRTAVIEMAAAAGRSLLARPQGDEPVRASTAGVGQLVLAAVQAGARRVIVGCGGSATTDGGWAAVEAIGGPERLAGVDVVVATDVVTSFGDAAGVFGPQKGATPAQVVELTAHLEELAATYRARFGVDVAALAGAGSAGGLAGGLAALGAQIQPGFALVAAMVGLADRIARADLVVTGEGRLDATSFEGKVVGGVLDLVDGRVPVLCVVGDAEAGAASEARDRPGTTVVSLVERAGRRRARAETVALVESEVARYLAGR